MHLFKDEIQFLVNPSKTSRPTRLLLSRILEIENFSEIS